MENMTSYDFRYRFRKGTIFLLKFVSQLPEAQKNMAFMSLNGPTDGITDFGIAQAKHCNLAFCSFLPQMAGSTTFFDGARNNLWCKWLD